MRRTIAGTAAVLLTSLVIGGPLASPGGAASATLHCAGGSAPSECALLDDLAAQLGPIAPLLGSAAPSATPAADLAARSDSPAGVPTAEVVGVSTSLLAQLGGLPAPVQALVGAPGLRALTGTLQGLVDGLAAPVGTGGQQSSSSSGATAARTSRPSVAVPTGGARSMEASGAQAPAAPGGATSNDKVPAVPVGDPLALAPLALPEFGFDPAFAPAPSVEVAPAAAAEEAKLAAVTDELGGNRWAELAVVAALSILLLAAAGVAQLQANRHQIAD
ncbi:MAG: hypothetical protein ACJ739_08500 [Acidimicrobiales bacterium]